jgi:hypothetical protein
VQDRSYVLKIKIPAASLRERKKRKERKGKKRPFIYREYFKALSLKAIFPSYAVIAARLLNLKEKRDFIFKLSR